MNCRFRMADRTNCQMAKSTSYRTTEVAVNWNGSEAVTTVGPMRAPPPGPSSALPSVQWWSSSVMRYAGEPNSVSFLRHIFEARNRDDF